MIAFINFFREPLTLNSVINALCANTGIEW